jgi:hypothetical protein
MINLTLMEGIAHEEGFYVSGSRAARNFNPGNLNFAPWEVVKFGAVLETIPAGYNETPRFAAFPSAQSGWSAMQYLLTTNYLGESVQQALSIWAPTSDDNNVPAYVSSVCSMCGVTPATLVTAELIGAVPNS